MKLQRRDFQKLRMPLLASLLMATVGVGLASWSLLDSEQASERQRANAEARTRAERRLNQAKTEEEDLKQRAALFQQLEKRQILGPERRLEWTELLQESQRELRIPGLRYEFGAQQPATADAAPYRWQASPAKLRLRLLHEEDLLRFLARVEAQAPALVLTRACKLAPAPAPSDARERYAQLAAECDMQWLTLRPEAAAK